LGLFASGPTHAFAGQLSPARVAHPFRAVALEAIADENRHRRPHRSANGAGGRRGRRPDRASADGPQYDVSETRSRRRCRPASAWAQQVARPAILRCCAGSSGLRGAWRCADSFTYATRTITFSPLALLTLSSCGTRKKTPIKFMSDHQACPRPTFNPPVSPVQGKKDSLFASAGARSRGVAHRSSALSSPFSPHRRPHTSIEPNWRESGAGPPSKPPTGHVSPLLRSPNRRESKLVVGARIWCRTTGLGGSISKVG
jgi:hypothetical protein